MRIWVDWGCQIPYENLYSFKCGLVFLIRPFCTECTLWLAFPAWVHSQASFKEKIVDFNDHYFDQLPKISTLRSVNWIWGLFSLNSILPAVLSEWLSSVREMSQLFIYSLILVWMRVLWGLCGFYFKWLWNLFLWALIWEELSIFLNQHT